MPYRRGTCGSFALLAGAAAQRGYGILRPRRGNNDEDKLEQSVEIWYSLLAEKNNESGALTLDVEACTAILVLLQGRRNERSCLRREGQIIRHNRLVPCNQSGIVPWKAVDLITWALSESRQTNQGSPPNLPAL
jgi:hypothetical protein